MSRSRMKQPLSALPVSLVEVYEALLRDDFYPQGLELMRLAKSYPAAAQLFGSRATAEPGARWHSDVDSKWQGPPRRNGREESSSVLAGPFRNPPRQNCSTVNPNGCAF
jgi:hypothetical protein